jgi:uncharacterized protein YkwD
MPLTLFDFVFLGVFIVLTIRLARKSILYTSYDFVKIILVLVFTFLVTRISVSVVPYHSYFSTIQFVVVSQIISFVSLWFIIRFKKLFYHIPFSFRKFNTYLNYLPIAVVSFFLGFSFFLLIASYSTKSSLVYKTAEKSYIMRLVSFRLYIAYFKTTPPRFGDLSKLSGYEIAKQQDRINEEREKEGLKPIGMETVVIAVPTGTVPKDVPFAPTAAPSPEPEPTIIYIPLPLPTVYLTPKPVVTTIVTRRATQTRIVTPIPLPTEIPTPTEQPINVSLVEQQIFNLTNIERVNNKLRPFNWSNAVAAVARAHSVDMRDRNFFAHVNPDGIDPFQRMRIGGIKYNGAAENIARGGRSAEQLVQGWMNSPPHRANILNPKLGTLGVGVAETSTHTLYATQDFTN